MKEVIAKYFFAVYRVINKWLMSHFDGSFLDPGVPTSLFISNKKWMDYLCEIGNHKGMRILEIGSREVTGPSWARRAFTRAHYTGFDFYPGPNVDVVGDVHRLSDYFEDKFDLIFSSAVLEHLAMPWVAALEIAKLLKIGGIVFIETHFSFSSHERPWHFYQFSDLGLRVLFSSALGFECLAAGMSNPMIGRFSRFADPQLRYTLAGRLYCHSEFLGRKIKEIHFASFDWRELDLNDLVSGTTYPLP